MANPSNFQITRIVESNEINFRSLYIDHNWTVYDGNDTVVACFNGNWHNTFSLEFKVGRFKGSTLHVMGISGKWAIVGGTRQFDRATGVISKKRNVRNRYAIHAFCPLPNGSLSLVTKIGPWGGNGGKDQDITVAPRRLKSITVCYHKDKVVKSIAFSYIDHDDQRRTSRPPKRPRGGSDEYYKIELDSSERVEFVKEVSGRFGTYKDYTVILSLKFVTNVEKHRTLGDISRKGTRFSVPVQDSSVVGFFGRGGKYLYAFGVYVRPF